MEYCWQSLTKKGFRLTKKMKKTGEWQEMEDEYGDKDAQTSL